MNSYWRHVGEKVLISEKGRAYRKAVIDCIWQVVGAKQFGDARVAVTLQLIPPDRRKRDIDNFNKALFDALSHAGIWNDDEQIDDLHVIKQPANKTAAMVRVVITDLAQIAV
ncbi:RusA family crossover junction endodeoxyribonuclease [Deefgea sp. CFH1-16]|nr:RusA family crossover junction endodeoxyribonuclease [Deefgea sp. CFH1-16]